MTTMLRSGFMGRTLQSGPAAPRATQPKFQVSAIFKKAEKEGKKVQQKAKQALPPKGKGTQVVKQAQSKAKKAGPSFPSPPSKKSAQKAPQRAATQVFGGAKKAGNKAQSKAKNAGSSSKGWFGEERASGLDKWYGTYICQIEELACCTTGSVSSLVHSYTGPSRALFLPRGLLDEAEIPGYLNGQLAGE